MASYVIDTDMTILEHMRIWHKVPDHIPDEQIEKYVEILQGKDIYHYEMRMVYGKTQLQTAVCDV